eukprot:scaffold1670_cov370-Prasinococcus_capsulatus_cf.AAC.1
MELLPLHGCGESVIREGSLVIVYENHCTQKFVRATAGKLFQNRFGVFRHDDWIGRPFGCKVRRPRARALGGAAALTRSRARAAAAAGAVEERPRLRLPPRAHRGAVDLRAAAPHADSLPRRHRPRRGPPRCARPGGRRSRPRRAD